MQRVEIGELSQIVGSTFLYVGLCIKIAGSCGCPPQNINLVVSFSVFQPQKWEDDRPTTVIFFQSGGSTTSYEQVWKTIGGLAHPSIHPRTEKTSQKKSCRRRRKKNCSSCFEISGAPVPAGFGGTMDRN